MPHIRPSRHWLPLISALLLLPALVLAQGKAEKLPAPAHYAVFLLGQRAGKMTVTYERSVLYGKPVYSVDADSTIRVAALGEVDQSVRVRIYVTEKGDPVFQRAEISALGRKSVISARYYPDRVECQIEAGGQKTLKNVPIPKGITLTGDKDFSLDDRKMRIGDRESAHYFEPTTLSIQKVSTEVLRRETVTIGSKSFNAFVVKSVDTAAGESTEWLDENGELLQSEAKIGLKMVREDFGALPAAYAPPKDFLAATSVRTDRPITGARKLRVLHLRLTGVPGAELVLSDARQKATVQGSGATVGATFELRASDPPETSSPALPADSRDPLVQDSPYLGLTDPAIRKHAREIVGSETDRAVIARRIRAWVHSHISKPRNAGILRAAPEILVNRDGVCREYATLFAALARSTGVPTRLCGGLIYFEDGFYYHAWVECRLIDNPETWVPFDATLDMDFVDATHVKLSHGDVTEMFQAARSVGQLKAEVLRTE